MNMQVEKTCRVCLRGSDELTPLRVRLPGKTRTFDETINFVVNIHILLENGLPDKICKDCGAMLDVADTFKQKVLESEAFLNQIAEKRCTDEYQPKIEEQDQVNGDKCSAEASCASIATSRSSLSDSLVAKVQNQDGYPNPKEKIKIEVNEEEYPVDGITGSEEAILPDNQELEMSQTEVKEEFVIKEEMPVNYVENKDFFTKPMKHMKLMHYSCKDCEIDFPSRDSLESHRTGGPCSKKLHPEDVRPSTSRLTVPKEDQNAKFKANTKSTVKKRGRPPKLDIKQYKIKPSSEIKKKQTLFVCNECGKPYIRKRHLISHIKIHTDLKPYSCNVCEKKFKRKLQLENHSRTHTGDRPYSCSVCGKNFSQKAHLDTHEKTHLGCKPYACDVCDKKFTRQRHLKIHNRIHTGEKPFTCQVCSKSFGMKSTLLNHERAHTGDRPYSCSFCDKKFIQKPHLDCHVRIHTGEKPYGCNMCEKKFRESSSLAKHVRLHTGVRPYSCGVCMRTFNDSSNLKRHSCKIKQSY